MQCDIDIIGSSSISSEIELIHTTAKALLSLDIKDFTVKINDRRILRALLKGVGFEESQLDSVCITFDKMDKIGAGALSVSLPIKALTAVLSQNSVKSSQNHLLLKA